MYICAYSTEVFPQVSNIWFISEVVEPKIINNWLPKVFPNAKWRETYGATECIPMGVSCEHNWIHFPFLNQHFKIEPCNKDLKTISISKEATFTDRYLLTSYLNTVQPLIKLEIKDAGIWKTNCKCGKPGLVYNCYGRTGQTYQGLYYKELLKKNYCSDLLAIEFSNNIKKFTPKNLIEYYHKINQSKFICQINTEKNIM